MCGCVGEQCALHIHIHIDIHTHIHIPANRHLVIHQAVFDLDNKNTRLHTALLLEEERAFQLLILNFKGTLQQLQSKQDILRQQVSRNPFTKRVGSHVLLCKSLPLCLGTGHC